MSFMDALRFPFQKSILKTVFKFIAFYLLVSTIANISIIFVPVDLYFSNRNLYQFLGYLDEWLFIPFMLFVSGYSITVIYHLGANQEGLPAPEPKRDFACAFMLILSNIAHIIPSAILYVVLSMFINPNPMSYSYGRPATGNTFFMLCGLWLVLLLVNFFIQGSQQVGVIRFAFERNSGLLFEYFENFEYVKDNKAFIFGFFAYSIGLSIIFGLLFFAMDWALSNLEYFTIINIDGIGRWIAMAIRIINSGLTLLCIVVLQLATAHLQAKLGNDLGISLYKSKHDEQLVPTS